MKTRAYGTTRITLPSLDPTDQHLDKVDHLGGDTVRDFLYTDADLRDLDLTDTALLAGRIRNLSAQRTTMTGVRLSSVEITASTIAFLAWSGSRATQTHWAGSRLMGATITDVTLNDVLFEGCRLDYAVFENVRAAGTVVLDRCVLTEATFTGCDLNGVVLRDCVLDRTAFGRGQYRGTDLRGNDLSTIRGTANLTGGIMLDPSQPDQLTRALLTELGVTVRPLDQP
ncbi:pentapeptide repeat-containing protein [Kitasatospora sp. NPDC004531]